MATATQISPRILAARENGRKGGQARAKSLSADQKSRIAKMGGDATANYGSSFYSWVNKQRKNIGR